MAVTFSKDGNWFGQYRSENAGDHYSLQQVDVACSLKRIRENIYLEGRLATMVTLACSRCLEEAVLPVTGAFSYTFSPAGEPRPEEMELSADDMDIVYYDDELIDLDPIIYEQIVMNIPMKVLCSDACRGLCPNCGINLNRESCQCRDQRIDERFAILKKLKAEKSN